MDNSPRWDSSYANVVPGQDLPRTYAPTSIMWAATSMRPSDLEYDRYIWLVEQMKRANYDDEILSDVMVSRSRTYSSVHILAVACDVSRHRRRSRQTAVRCSRTPRLGQSLPVRCRFRDQRTQRCSKGFRCPRRRGSTPRPSPASRRCCAAACPANANAPSCGCSRARISAVTLICGSPYRRPPRRSPGLPRPRILARPRLARHDLAVQLGLRPPRLARKASRLRSEGLRQVTDGHFAEYYELSPANRSAACNKAGPPPRFSTGSISLICRFKKLPKEPGQWDA